MRLRPSTSLRKPGLKLSRATPIVSALALSAAMAAIWIPSAAADALTRVAQADGQLTASQAQDRLCDLLTASPYDETRPTGISGIDLDKIDAAQAVPACRAALARHPNDSRVPISLAGLGVKAKRTGRQPPAT
jgi:hypothetical protein